MARPRKNENDKRIHQVNIRLTEDEFNKSNEQAIACGLSQANWIRETAFKGKFPAPKLSAIDAAAYQELNKIGVNLNQITHKINIGELPQEYPARQTELMEILTQIIKKLANDR